MSRWIYSSLWNRIWSFVFFFFLQRCNTCLIYKWRAPLTVIRWSEPWHARKPQSMLENCPHISKTDTPIVSQAPSASISYGHGYGGSVHNLPPGKLSRRKKLLHRSTIPFPEWIFCISDRHGFCVREIFLCIMASSAGCGDEFVTEFSPMIAVFNVSMFQGWHIKHV